MKVTTIKEIDNGTFSGCSSLLEVGLPISLTEIGDDVFEDCISLNSIVLPNTIVNIGSSVFAGCVGLTSIEMPNSLKKIGRNTFNGCVALMRIKMNAATPPECASDNVFKKVPVASCLLEVPGACKTNYQNAKVWKDFNNIKEMVLMPVK